MKLSMTLNYAGGFEESARQAVALEKVGLDVVWVAEAYSYDAPSFMGFLAAKTERSRSARPSCPSTAARPTLIAMTAAGVDAVSGGRCILGLGASGPQVIEGFHGVPYDRPLTRTREIIDVCRQVWAREAPLVHDGAAYHIPLPAGEGTGLGKPLKLINHPVRPRIPIWVAALGEKNVAMTAEVADGWLPIFFFPEKAKEVFGPSLAAGTAKRDPSLGHVADRGRRAPGHRRGGRGRAHPRPGPRRWPPSTSAAWGPRARTSTTRWRAATATRRRRPRSRTSTSRARRRRRRRWCPTELLEATSLCGPEAYIKERVAAMAEAGVTHLNVTPVGDDPVAMVEKLRSWV